MRQPTDHHRSRVRIAIAIGATLLTATGIVGLLSHQQQAPSTLKATGAQRYQAATQQPHTTATSGRAGRSAAVGYASRFATQLLTWDSTATSSPTDQMDQLVAEADPSGVETPGLVADLANYLPTAIEWTHLRRHAVTQSATIHTAVIPDSWEPIPADAAVGLSAGTTAVTIQATLHRRGSSGGQQHSSDHPLTFTIFLACPPDGQSCHVLRLSVPGTPLR